MRTPVSGRALAVAAASAVVTAVAVPLLQQLVLSRYLIVLLALLAGVLTGRVLGGTPRLGIAGSLVALAFQAPHAIAPTELATIGVLAIAALGLNILTGWAGQLNLAQGILVGLGAYTTAILATDHGWPVLATLPVAAAVVAAIGALLGVIALRFEGVFLAVLTTSVALVAPIVLKRFSGFTGGTGGIAVDPVPIPDSISTASFNYWLVLLLALLAAGVSWNLLSGRTGRALTALRESVHAAEGVGIDITRYKILAFALSSLWAGLAGGLYAITVGFINPDSFGLFYGIQFLTMIVVGGLATISGSFIGAALVYEVSVNVQAVGVPVTVLGQQVSLPQQGVFAVLLILGGVLAPQGVAGVLRDPSSRRRAWSRIRSIGTTADARISPDTTTGRIGRGASPALGEPTKEKEQA